MNSSIAKKAYMADLFKSQYVHEVYASKDFDFAQDICTLYILSTYRTDSKALLLSLNSIFKQCTVCTSNRPNDNIFFNERIIYRDGVWYV